MKDKNLNRLDGSGEGLTSVEVQLGDKATIKFRLASPLTDALKQVLVETVALKIGAPLIPTFKEKYEKAHFGKLRRSEVKCRAFEFLSTWRHRIRIAREDGRAVTDQEFVRRLSPLIDALNRLDVPFFKGLAQAVRILEERAYSNKNREPTTLDKWLLEFAMQNGWERTHTTRELNEQFVSKFRKMEDKKLRDRCRELGIPLKDGRGRPRKIVPL